MTHPETSEMDARVLIRRCEEYDRDTLERMVREGMATLGYAPHGKTFVKPNVVFAGDPEVFGRHAYTQPQLMGASLLALAKCAEVDRVDLGENGAVGFPTRNFYTHAGYYDEIRWVQKHTDKPVDIFCLDEDRRDTVAVDGVVHKTLRLARTMARADSTVYLPKLKCHCVTRMTGAVKLNIGICGDDDRAIRHDFMLNEKIVDLLAVGWPDFIVMDAIEVGVGNEAFPTPRKLGLVLMGKNPVAVDLVGARLLGLQRDDVPYLKLAVERGYGPASLEDVTLLGDLETLAALDEAARRVGPYDEDFYAWQDISKELVRLGSPMRFYGGPHRYHERHGGPADADQEELCETGCVMGIKMFLASYEVYGGREAFAKQAKPVVFVAGRVDEPIDAAGEEVFLIGKCAQATITNAKKVIRVEKCFTTASDMSFALGTRLGLPTPLRDPKIVAGLAKDMASSSFKKVTSFRFMQDLGTLMRRGRR